MGKIEKPFLDPYTFEYNSNKHSPRVQGFDPETMTKSGAEWATKAGTYQITVQLKDTNTNTWADNSSDPVILQWSITAISLAKPYLNNDVFEYDGNVKTPDVIGFDSDMMTASGSVTAIEEGEYVLTYELKDPTSCAWEDDTTGSVSLPWSIVDTRENNTPNNEKVVTFDQLGIVKNYIDKKVADVSELPYAADSEVEEMFPIGT